MACGGGVECGGDVLMLELNGFYNMDCIKGMKHFSDNYFDLAIVDPPYGINVTRKGEIGGVACSDNKIQTQTVGHDTAARRIF